MQPTLVPTITKPDGQVTHPLIHPTARPPTPVATITQHFSTLEDPRRYNRRHLLQDMIVIAICAVICGADTWVEVETFGHAKHDWLKQFLALPHGIPAHDTFGRVFGLLDAPSFQSCFMAWIQAVYQVTDGQLVPIDGKTLRRSHDKALGRQAIHMVSAWAAANGVILGQVKVDDKSNEITAIPQLLALLDISGCIVTIDAMGCQKQIVAQIIDQDADYTLAVKKTRKACTTISSRCLTRPKQPTAPLVITTKRSIKVTDALKSANAGSSRTPNTWSTSAICRTGRACNPS